MIWAFLRSSAGRAAAIVLFVVGVLGAVFKMGDSSRKAKRKLDDLEAEIETRERMDDAKPAKNVDDARDSLAGFLHRNDK